MFLIDVSFSLSPPLLSSLKISNCFLKAQKSCEMYLPCSIINSYSRSEKPRKLKRWGADTKERTAVASRATISTLEAREPSDLSGLTVLGSSFMRPQERAQAPGRSHS